MRHSYINAALALLITPLSAQHLSQFCPSSDICYNLNIPEETASSGSGDIYFQISGPTSYSWIGLGQGSGMVGANIFVMYTDGDGNVTVSPRYASGHVEPEHDTVANITLLEGSGVAGGNMIANVKCSNCDGWQGGSMDFTSKNGGWIHASLPGKPINSRDLDAEISEHEDHGTFTWDFTKAKGGNDVNPFVTASKTTSPVSSPATPNGGVPSSSQPAEVPSVADTFISAHGTVASVAFLVVLPIGAIFIRIPALSKFGGVWVHAGIQIVGYCLFIAAAGMGIWIAKVQEELRDYHPIIGMLLLGLVFTQPFAGFFHHRFFKQKGRRTLISYDHIWVGRVAIILGMINGGLGLKLAGNTNMGYLAAYGVVAGVMGSLYIVAIIYGETKRARSLSAEDAAGRKEANRGLESHDSR